MAHPEPPQARRNHPTPPVNGTLERRHARHIRHRTVANRSDMTAGYLLPGWHQAANLRQHFSSKSMAQPCCATSMNSYATTAATRLSSRPPMPSNFIKSMAFRLSVNAKRAVSLVCEPDLGAVSVNYDRNDLWIKDFSPFLYPGGSYE